MSLNPTAVSFVPSFGPSPGSPPGTGGSRSKKNKNNSAKPKASVKVPASVNRADLSYSPTGALYGPAVLAAIAKAEYSPTGAGYGAGARYATRLHTELTPTTHVALLKQIEFYFGDSNFPKDKFLQKATKKYDGGFVPLGILCGFKKVEKFTSNAKILARAIEDSTLVEFNPDKTAIRRRTAVAKTQINSSWGRTVVVENLPPNTSIDATVERFAPCGTVEHVRIIKQNAKALPKDIDAYLEAAGRGAHDVLKHSRGCALVEYSSVEEATKACTTLTDKNNWRSGLRVTMLWRKKAQGKAAKAGKESNEQNEQPTATEGVEETGSPVVSRQKRFGSRRQRLFEEHPELANVGKEPRRKPKNPLPAVAAPMNVLRNPTMPDGTRGFGGLGRGKAKPAVQNTHIIFSP